MDGLFSFLKSALFEDIGEVNVASYGAFNVQLPAKCNQISCKWGNFHSFHFSGHLCNNISTKKQQATPTSCTLVAATCKKMWFMPFTHPPSLHPVNRRALCVLVVASQRLQSVTAEGRDGSGTASEQTARLLQTVMITHVRYSAQTPTLLCHDSIQAVWLKRDTVLHNDNKWWILRASFLATCSKSYVALTELDHFLKDLNPWLQTSRTSHYVARIPHVVSCRRIKVGILSNDHNTRQAFVSIFGSRISFCSAELN